jgi:hypothetical protein|tara:strand:- start:603 stop:926 length:324 start_codon:yes stop_codon:yes gene_type:complete
MKNLIIIFLLFASSVTAQVEVIHFNAGWNSSNDVEWVHDLNDCEIKHIDIAENTKAQGKYDITVVPTILILDDGEEDERYEADISFTMKTTKEEVQEYIDELIINKF